MTATTTPPADKNADTAKQMTVAQAAKLVKRTVTETVEKNGEKKVVTKKVAVAEKDVLAFKDYGTHVVVVTTDGQKLSSKDAKGGDEEA